MLAGPMGWSRPTTPLRCPGLTPTSEDRPSLRVCGVRRARGSDTRSSGLHRPSPIVSPIVPIRSTQAVSGGLNGASVPGPRRFRGRRLARTVSPAGVGAWMASGGIRGRRAATGAGPGPCGRPCSPNRRRCPPCPRPWTRTAPTGVHAETSRGRHHRGDAPLRDGTSLTDRPSAPRARGSRACDPRGRLRRACRRRRSPGAPGGGSRGGSRGRRAGHRPARSDAPRRAACPG